MAGAENGGGEHSNDHDDVGDGGGCGGGDGGGGVGQLFFCSPFKTFKGEFDPKKIFLRVQMTKSTKVYTCCGYVDDMMMKKCISVQIEAHRQVQYYNFTKITITW